MRCYRTRIFNTLKDVRRRCFLSQSDFADAIGVSFSTVNRWGNGRAIQNYKTLKRIKEYCDQYNFYRRLREYRHLKDGKSKE
ncbi:helix-turn-helix transcriptional regulator [Anaerovoracaceae bacterium 42-11]